MRQIEVERQKQGTRSGHLSNPQKAHPTSEFVIVSYNRDYRARSLVRRLSNVIRQAGRQTKNPVLAIFKKLIIIYSMGYSG